MPIALIVLFLVLIAVMVFAWRRLRASRRVDFIRHYSLPIGLYEKLRKRRPDLTTKDCQLVGNALRQFFLAHLASGRRFVSMPSQVVDDLWHEFILYTRNYQDFCHEAFGRFMHHTPAVVMTGEKNANSGLRRCWWYACKEENINPRKPLRLPLLFALDAKLNIADGFRYLPNCHITGLQAGEGRGTIYCGSDFSSAGADGSTNGFGDSGFFGGSTDSSGSDGGGDGDGGGCGGGD